ncbi:hypothetical protein HO133_006828 [Letharia lupina]|uniref:Uncharacterized protein n=1 Tax=Letharia lupina TaxID=560253 RepID=A0A8H6F6H2_9LECA|nr:uncharacterized protein HO133_006828 [Letharia lupina]KAF6217490.1 hypothetical protein HO133_006828 [Letharia lupina]
MKSNLLNTADPPLANVHIIDDRTRVIFGVDPRAAATRSSVKSAEQKKKNLFQPADLLHLTSGDTFDADEQLESPASARNSNIASMGDTENLDLLACVALATHSKKRQQPAHGAPSKEAVTADSLPPAEQQPSHTEYSTAYFDAYYDASPQETTETGFLSRDEQQPVHVPSSFEAANSTPPAEQRASYESTEWGVADEDTQGAHTISNASTPTQQEPVRGALNQGFTAINPRATNGGLSRINPRPLPGYMPAAIGPSGGRQPIIKKSRKCKPRTTGFNRKTGEGMLTEVCNIATPAKGTPVAHTNKDGRYRCARCKGRFTRTRTVKDHFITCVNKYGNPNKLSWYDHPTLAKSKDWHLGSLAMAKEAEDGTEWEEDDDEQEQDQEGDDDFPEQHVDDSIAWAIESDTAADEEDEDGDSHMGNEDQGRDGNISAASTPYYTPNEGSSLSASIQGSRFHTPQEGSDTPGYGPDGYRTPVPSNIRGWSATPRYTGGSYTPSFGRGYETPVQNFGYDSDLSRDTDIIRRRETEGYGDETPTPGYDEEGDFIMAEF